MAVAPDLPSPDETVALARRWHASAAGIAPEASAVRLADLLADPDGFAFAFGVVDRVVRPEDAHVAARALERLSRRLPRALSRQLRTLLAAGGGFGVLTPQAVIPIVRRVMRETTAHLVADATPKRLGRTLAALREAGFEPDLTPSRAPALGDKQAARNILAVRELIARDDVDRVTIRLSALAPRRSEWAPEEAADRLADRLAPLHEQAAARPATRVTLETEGFRDRELALAVFARLLERPELARLELGIALQAYLPETAGALEELTDRARARTAAGGAGIAVRLVKGSRLAEERAEAALTGWPLATWERKQETDAAYLRLLAAALSPGATAAVRVGVASHNVFDLAFARLLADGRGLADRLDVELLHGMATPLAHAVRADLGRLRLLVPVVHPGEFDEAIGDLARRLAENASDEGAAALRADPSEAAFDREAERFTAAFAAMADPVPATRRPQNRLSPPLPRAPEAFRHEPLTDPSRPTGRAWARGVLDRAGESRLGEAAADAARVEDPARMDALVHAAAEAGAHWGRVPPHTRAELLDRVAEVLAVFRGRLAEAMTSETGTTIGEADARVSEAIDAALHAAGRARELAAIRDARFAPVPLVLVAPPAAGAVAIAASGVTEALAAGAAVVVASDPRARRQLAVLAEALWEAGVPRELLTLVEPGDEELARRLVSAPRLGRVLLTGARERAELSRTGRPELPLLASLPGVVPVVVTPSADTDLAVADLVTSAFGDAGQGAGAASVAILVGSVASSERFRARLADAVSSLAVGYPEDPATTVGPLMEPVRGPLERTLTTLEEGESWLVKPRQLDASDRLWAPGVRDGVAPGSAFLAGETRGPVLGLMRAATLAEAIELQNAVGGGFAAGLHSLDVDELSAWLEGARAGSLWVNRATTGATAGRQPAGGWGASSVGPGAKAGGPNSLLVLGSWHPVPATPEGDLRLDGLDDRARAVIEAFQPALDYGGFDAVRRGAYSDAEAWAVEFGAARDTAGLGVERNVLRYRPVPVTVRLAEGGALADLARVLAAAALARAPIAVSSAAPVPPGGIEHLGWSVVVEDDEAFAERVARERPARVRLIAGDAAGLARAAGGSLGTAVHGDPVTASGRIELLAFLVEQSVSITAHRFGIPDDEVLALGL